MSLTYFFCRTAFVLDFAYGKIKSFELKTEIWKDVTNSYSISDSLLVKGNLLTIRNYIFYVHMDDYIFNSDFAGIYLIHPNGTMDVFEHTAVFENVTKELVDYVSETIPILYQIRY